MRADKRYEPSAMTGQNHITQTGMGTIAGMDQNNQLMQQ